MVLSMEKPSLKSGCFFLAPYLWQLPRSLLFCKMASAMLRGSKVLWWIAPPAAGLTYHLTTLKAADNPRKKIDPRDLEIYDKPEDQSKSSRPDDHPPTSLEQQISKGRQFVWKHSDKVKNVTDRSAEGAKTFWDKTKEFTTNIQTDQTLQLKSGAIAAASLTGILVAGRGRRPLRRVFFAGILGTATAAVCYPGKAASTVKSAYHKLASYVSGGKSQSSKEKVQFDESVDQFRSGETLMLEEAIILSEMLYEELLKRLHVDDIHLADFMTICKEVVNEVFLGISEDFEIQTGGYVSAEHAPHVNSDVILDAKDVTQRLVQEVLDSINEDIEIQTGGAVTGVATIALDSTVLAKDISTAVSKTLERDIVSGASGIYLFLNPEALSRVVCEEYTKCVEATIRSQVPTGKCHVIINSTNVAAKTAAEIKMVLEGLKNSRLVLLSADRIDNTYNSSQAAEQVGSKLLSHIEQGIRKSDGKYYAFSEASRIVQKASEEATKAIASDVQGSGQAAKNRKTKVMLDLAKKVGEEVIEAINEDIEIQTGSGLRGPSDGKPKPPRKPPTPVSKGDAATLDGIMYSPMYVPGFDHVADAVIEEVSEALHGRGVVVHELDQLAHETMKEILAGVSEDIEIQTGGWVGREHKTHAVLDGKGLVRKIADKVLQAIEEDMNIQTGGKLERKRDLYFDSERLAKNIVDSVMGEVNRDIKESEASTPYLFSDTKELGQLAVKELQNNIDQAAIGIGRNVGRIHVDVEALSEDVGMQLKDRIEERYIQANSFGELRDREVTIVDFGEIRKRVGGTIKRNLTENALVTPRSGNEPVHVVKEWGELMKGVVETMTKAIQEDIEIQTGGAKVGTSPRVVIDARGLMTSIIEEVTEAVQEDIDIQTGRGFRSDESKARDEKPPGDPGQSEPEDKDMYSTRTSQKNGTK